MQRAEISLIVEIPQELHEALRRYLDEHPNQSQQQVLASAISLFLMQQGEKNQDISRIYLNALFGL